MLTLFLSVGGTTGAIITCPLEVVKTRLQSSNSGFHGTPPDGNKPLVSSQNGTGVSMSKSKPHSTQRLVVPQQVVSDRLFQVRFIFFNVPFQIKDLERLNCLLITPDLFYMLLSISRFTGNHMKRICATHVKHM